MKVLVAVKRVADYNVKVRIKSDGSGVELANVKMAMNPFDEIACEAAVRLKEANLASEVVVVSCGTSSCEETLRFALAIGADRGILIDTGSVSEATLQPLAVAKLLKKVVERELPHLMMLGKQAIDDDSGQVGQMLSGLLGWPQATCISNIDADKFMRGDSGMTFTREIDGGLETLALRLPAIVTTDLRLNEPRYATLPNIMKAKKKPVEKISAGEFGVDVSPRLELLSVSEPPKRAPGVRVADVSELVEKLRFGAKVI